MPADLRNKEVALGRIKRLASSGLLLEPLVRSVFDLINDAVPNNPNRGLHVGSERFSRLDRPLWCSCGQCLISHGNSDAVVLSGGLPKAEVKAVVEAAM